MIAAAVVATFVMMLTAIVFESDFKPQVNAFTFQVTLVAMLDSAIIAVAAMVLVCVPLTLMLSFWALERSWTYPSFGSITGIVAATIVLTPAWNNPSDLSLDLIIREVLFGGLAGLSAGLVWWFAYRKARAFDHTAEELS